MIKVKLIYLWLFCLISLGFSGIDTRVIQVIDDNVWSLPPQIRLDVQVRNSTDAPVSISGWQNSYRIANTGMVDKVEFSHPAFEGLDYQVFKEFRKSDGRLALAATHRSGTLIKCASDWTTLFEIILTYFPENGLLSFEKRDDAPVFLVLGATGSNITGQDVPLPGIRQLHDISYPLQRGWQLISLPGIAPTMQVSELFPQAIGGVAFDWIGDVYYPVERLVPGRGYWIAQSEAQELKLKVFSSGSYERTFYERGWFLIGGLDERSSFDAPQVDPSGSIYPPAFFYDNAAGKYRGVTTLEPGLGYWIAVLRPCIFKLENDKTQRLGKHLSYNKNIHPSLSSDPPPPPGIDTSVLTDLDADMGHTFQLLQNYPNPFNPQTTIPFFVRKRERVRIGIYNVNGQLVRLLKDQEISPGLHRVVWDGRDQSGQRVGAGVYLCKMQSTGFMDVKKLILVH